VQEALVSLFGPAWPGTLTPNTLPERLLYTTLVFIGLDFGFFYSHYLSHKLPMLWCLHKVHHSPPVLVPFTAMRFHPLDMLWNMVWGGGCAVIVAGICQYLFYQGHDVIEVFTNNLWVAISYLTIHNFRHSHIWIMFPPRLSRWLISPAQHQLHHSRERRHIDKNMGYLIAVWDRMFGTLYVPEAREQFRMGVHGMPREGFYAHDSVRSLLLCPLVEVWRYLSGQMSAADAMGAVPQPPRSSSAGPAPLSGHTEGGG
jgi:sterol desaturase/sphingolipid hydroxylase (fatty acid hydroxylase superfamily)